MASIKEQLAKMAVTKMKTGTGETYAEILKREVDRLYDCIQYEIDRFYRSYKPTMYHRTYRFQSALYAENLVDARVEGNKIKLSLLFHPNLADHPNLVGDETNIPVILNYGYHARGLEEYIGHSVPNFTERKGFYFIENGILNWNKENKLGITIDVTAIYDGKQFFYF